MSASVPDRHALLSHAYAGTPARVRSSPRSHPTATPARHARSRAFFAAFTPDRHARSSVIAAVLLLGAALAGCGKSLPVESPSRGAEVTTVAGTGQLAASGLATKNTTRIGGGDPVANAAAVALATNPGLTPATRPQAVVLVNDRDWSAALAAAALASAPLRAPLLYSEGNVLPALSAEALAALKPTGAALLGGVQVIEVGTSAAPAGYRTSTLSGGQSGGLGDGERTGHTPADGGAQGGEEPTNGAGAGGGSADGAETAGGPAGGTANGGGPAGGTTNSGVSTGGAQAGAAAALAARIERLVARIHGRAPRRVIVVGADGPPALAMPAAGLAAESGAPILPVDAAGIPRATRRVLARLHRPVIYAVGPPAAVSHAVLAELARLGPVRRIYPGPGAVGTAGPGTSGEDPANNAIAVARFSDGPFGWDVEQPGHGLVFANASQPLDAPAAAPLSASGDYAPLLLLEHPNQVPPALSRYLSDIRPGYSEAPESEYPAVRGAYNHGWLIGGGEAITATVQAELDAMLEISPQSSSRSAGSAAVEPSTSAPSNTEPSTLTPTTPAP
jgi:hypothetical protein